MENASGSIRIESLQSSTSLEPEMLEVYVDDGRQAGAAFRLGTRFDPASKKLIITEKARKEDEDLKETTDVRIA